MVFGSNSSVVSKRKHFKHLANGILYWHLSHDYDSLGYPIDIKKNRHVLHQSCVSRGKKLNTFNVNPSECIFGPGGHL
jgi:hypothetical protein